ncbi:MAG: hypothetical protein WAZ40_03010 [Minisyncoccia bacterium]
MNYTDEQIEEKFDLLVDAVQDKLFIPEIESISQKIGELNSFTSDQVKKLNRLVNFSIMNLVPRKDFSSVVEKELAVTKVVAMQIESAVSREVFAPIEAMEAQAKKEMALYQTSDAEIIPQPNPIMPGIISPNKMTAKTTAAPENIPTPDTAESFLPKLIPKVPVVPTPTTATIHPFEDKLKQSFTTGEAPARIVSVETPALIVPAPPKVFTPVAPAVPTPQTYVTPKPEAPGVYKVDPYREAI